MPKHTALVVGIDYDKFPTGISADEQARVGLYPLRYAEADAFDMAAVLQDAGWQVVALLGQVATREAILTHLRQLRDDIGTAGPLVFYFAGHGVLDDETAYLMPVDANAQAPDVRGIALNDVTQRYLFKVGTAVALFDCCHSGYAVGVRGTPVDHSHRFLEEVQATFGQSEGHRILAACGGDELARELVKLQHGVFTYYALDHLRHYAGEVDVDSLYGHIARGLKTEGLQPPVSGGRQKGLIVLRPARTGQAMAAPVISSTPPQQLINWRTHFPELTDGDLAVLKLIGDYTLTHERYSYMNLSDLLEQAIAIGVAIEPSELRNSLQMLGESRLIAGEQLFGQQPYSDYIQCTTWGFQQYLDLYMPDYPNIRRGVINRLVQTEERDSASIAASLGQPQVLIEHIFIQLKQEDLLPEVVRYEGDVPVQIVGELPVRLRRMGQS